jgi:glycine betaine/proline transport system substrate-binding protein
MVAGMRGLVLLIGALALAAAGPRPAAADPAPAAANRLSVGHTARLADEVGAALAAEVLRRRLGYRVETVLADAPFLYSALAGGRIDLLPGAWTPDLHARFLQRLPAGVVRLGVLYRGARVGWLVPADAPAESLADLADPAVRRAFGDVVQAGEAGSGAVRLSRRALELYGLDGWRLSTSSPAGASLALTRALQRGDPAVATGRRPHWLHGTRPVRVLADPKGAFGGPQTVRVLGRTGFAAEHAWAAGVLGRMRLQLAEMQALVTRAHRDGVDAAVAAWLARHDARVDRWVARASDADRGN